MTETPDSAFNLKSFCRNDDHDGCPFLFTCECDCHDDKEYDDDFDD